MSIHTKTISSSDENIYSQIINFFSLYYTNITPEVDEEDENTLYFKEEDVIRAKIVNNEGKYNLTIYGNDEDISYSTNLPYSTYVTSSFVLTATSKTISVEVTTSQAVTNKTLGQLIFGESNNQIPFVVLGSKAVVSSMQVTYYTATGNDSVVSSSLTRIDLRNNPTYTWLINIPTGMEEGFVDYADSVYIPISYQLIGNTFPYIFKSHLMVNTGFITLDDGTYTG